MTPERWAQIEELFHRAAECEPERRTGLLDEACSDDPELRREVEALLFGEEHAGNHLHAAVRGVLDELERRYPSLYRGICDDTGAVRRHVNLYVNKDHMRDRDGLDTVLVPGDEIIILPAVSGG